MLAFDRSVGRYKHKMKNDTEMKDKIVSITHERRRFGYRRICIRYIGYTKNPASKSGNEGDERGL